jgi:uncharacterized protein (TIGR02246 family)
MLKCTLAAATVLLATTAQAAPPRDSDRAALEQLASRLDAVWDGGDAAAVTALYAGDGSVRMDGRAIEQGHAAVLRYFKDTIGRRPANLRHVTKLENIDMLTPDLALADAYVAIEQEQPDGARRLLAEFRNQTIAERQGGEWRFRAVRAQRMPEKKPAY